MDATTTQEVKTQSVYIPAQWKKNQEKQSISYLNWMAYTIQSKHYTDDQKISISLLTLNV